MTARTFRRVNLLAASFWLVGMLIWPEVSVAQIATRNSFSGGAKAAAMTVFGASTGLADTGALPPAGDALESSGLTASVPGFLNAEALHAVAIAPGQVDENDSEASLAALNVNLFGNTITSDFVMSHASAACTSGSASLGGSAEVDSLSINGVAVAITGAANQTIALPNGQVVINEQSQTSAVSSGSTTVNALHITINGVADVVISSANAGIACGIGI